jgi:hypothetical protein
MSVLADVALGAAPIAGGALMGVLAGTFKGPDYRALIKSDIELLDTIPEENVELRAALRRNIDARIYELIATVDKNRELREITASYKGNWRDFVVFICVAMFALVWWNVPHSRTNWLVTFVFLVALSALVGFYASRGLIRAFRQWLRPREDL